MPNITRQELDQLNEDLISVDPITGEKIASVDHRAMNELMINFLASFADIEATVAPNGTIVHDGMEKRKVSKLTTENGVLMSNYFLKPFAANILVFINGASLLLGTIVIISFCQP